MPNRRGLFSAVIVHGYHRPDFCDRIAANPLGGRVQMSTERYDDLVLGSGAGGKLLSWPHRQAAQ